MSSDREVPDFDRISALPDDILLHILSFLPTRHAVATGVLSKRWTPLWLSVPTLHFDDRGIADYFTFCYFIHKVLQFRKTFFPVHTFRLRCSFTTLEVSSWVYDAVQCGIEILELELPFTISCGIHVMLTPFLFNCRTLTALKLKKVKLCSLPSVDLPRLRTLHCEDVCFRRHECIMKLLFGCPALKELIVGLLMVSTKPGLEAAEVKSLPDSVRATFCCIPLLPLTLFRNVRFIYVIMVDLNYNVVPTFHNLTHLELCITPHMPWKWLVTFLEHSPKLQSLALDKLEPIRRCNDRNLYEGEWEDPQVVPECVSSQLRTCFLRHYYGGHECELRFARYIMQNSRVLQIMKVRVLTGCGRAGPEEILDMSRKLSLCPMISATCKLSFEIVPRVCKARC